MDRQGQAPPGGDRNDDPRNFDPTDPGTYTQESLKNMSLTELVVMLNDTDRRHSTSPEEQARIKTIILQSITAGLYAQRRRHDKRTLRRTPMFAARDGASLYRPAFGLKRTFFPRV